MDHLTQGDAKPASQLKQVLARSAIVAAILGSTLALVNQSDAIFGAAEIRWLPLFLAYLTPFLVVGLSQTLGLREGRKASARMTGLRESFVATVFSHGIPARAVALGLAAGGINTAVVASAALFAGRGLGQLPLALIVQALALPVLFGALSQAVSFRRAIRRAASSTS
ncbi:MAG: hypothetical protein ACE5EU_08115 [Paracoccaceae bacterium]